MMNSQNRMSVTDRLKKKLPMLLLIVFALQPLMDILSFWMSQFNMSNTATLILRFGVFALVVLAAFCVSSRKKIYFITAAVLAALFAGHFLSCSSVGYQDFVGDTTNFIRVVQMPLFAICFISFIQANDKCFEALENGFLLNYWIITAAFAISIITKSYSPTYQQTGFGILGWSSTSNAQSAILSLMAPIIVCLCICRKKNIFLFIATVATSFIQLYYLGTRLAFFAMFVTVFGVLLIMIITKKFSVKHVVILLVCLAVCCGFYKKSPMYANQRVYESAMASKQSDAARMMELAEQDDMSDDARERHLQALRVIYRFYSTKLCDRFGVDTVMEKYNYTYTISEITSVRPQKIAYCELLMDEYPFIARIFGTELSRMTFDDYIFDVENDFHGIFFLYGAAGLAMMIAFLLFFIILIILALKKDFKKYFNLHSGAFAMALCLSVIYAIFTAGVLRRPNSSFYLSAILAAVYGIVRLQKQPDIPEQLAS